MSLFDTPTSATGRTSPYSQPTTPGEVKQAVNIKLVGPPSQAALSGAPAPHEDAKNYQGMPTMLPKPEGRTE